MRYRWFESTSLQRTVRLSPAPLSKTKNLSFPRGCGRSAWRLGRLRGAGSFEIAPTGGNISVAPTSSTAVPLIGSARMPLRSDIVGAFVELDRAVDLCARAGSTKAERDPLSVPGERQA